MTRGANRTSTEAAARAAASRRAPGSSVDTDGSTRSLRAQHHDLTRELIMRSMVDQIEGGHVADITVPDVAKAAGVSVRTVYRHFATREALIAAASEWIVAHYWGDPSLPDTLDGQIAHWIRQAKAFDEHPNLMRALVISRAGQQVALVRRARRLEKQNRALREVTGNLSPAEQRQAEAVFGYLSNSLAWLTMRDENGFSGEESGAAVAWALRVLIDDLRRRNEAAAGADGKPRPKQGNYEVGG